MRILEECVRCFISSLFMGIFLAKAHCRYIPLIQRFKIIVFKLIYTIVNAFFGTFLDSSLLIFFSFCIIFIFTNVVYHDNILLALCLTIVVFILQAVVYLGWAFVGAVIQYILSEPDDFLPFILSLPLLIIGEITISLKISWRKIRKELNNKHKQYQFLLSGITLLSIYFGIRNIGAHGVYGAVPFFFLALILLILIFISTAKYNQFIEAETRRLAKENHDYKKYIPALTAAFNNEENMPSENTSALQYELALLQEEAHRNTASTAIEAQAYPPTGLILLDVLLERKAKECRENHILFSGCVLESPRFLLHHHNIDLQPLLAIIANLMDNAIRAVNQPCVKEKMILLHFGQAAGRIYQITIADSGMPFTLSTLENLGAVGNTTGGSGYGIASIIETCQKAHASVKLTEYGEQVTGFSKKICISFSGQFRIEIISPRWKELHPKYEYITIVEP